MRLFQFKNNETLNDTNLKKLPFDHEKPVETVFAAAKFPPFHVLFGQETVADHPFRFFVREPEST